MATDLEVGVDCDGNADETRRIKEGGIICKEIDIRNARTLGWALLLLLLPFRDG